MKLAYFESMDVTLGKGRLSSVLKNSCIHASIQKKAIRHGQPISIVNLKSNTMKNTVQIYRLLCYVAYFFTWKIHSLNHV